MKLDFLTYLTYQGHHSLCRLKHTSVNHGAQTIIYDPDSSSF